VSNALSIAATTLTLRSLLGQVASADYSTLPPDARPVNQIDITTLPPDQARPDNLRNRVNLYLYHTEYDPAWRNTDLPRRGRPGEVLPPVLPLNLHYLVTVYAENDNELIGQVLLGTAMRVLHDHPVLSRSEIETALAEAELDAQVERVRVTALPFKIEDLTAIWSGFQSEYRLSAGYKVGVLLIESSQAARAALPVLRRGGEDRGPSVVPGPAPSLTGVAEFFDASLPNPPSAAKPAAELGDTVVLTGAHLDGADMVVRLTHDRTGAVRELPLSPERDAGTVQFALPPASDPNVPGEWPAGFYTVELVVTRTDAPPWTTNRLTFAVAPSVSALAPASQPVGAQPFALVLTCTPQVLVEQRVSVLVRDRELAPDPGGVVTPGDPNQPSTVQVAVGDLAAGDHVVRLRIDGIDSLPVDLATAPPAFDAAQTLTITP
jgi:hypothetical protein